MGGWAGATDHLDIAEMIIRFHPASTTTQENGVQVKETVANKASGSATPTPPAPLQGGEKSLARRLGATNRLSRNNRFSGSFYRVFNIPAEGYLPEVIELCREVGL